MVYYKVIQNRMIGYEHFLKVIIKETGNEV